MIGSGKTQHINQGEYAVGKDPELMITTLLGSCVAACLYDPVAKVGGMNHILLPEDTGGAASGASFGVNAMELLINAVVKQGGDRRRLEAKVFGGGRMVKGLSNIGERNVAFVKKFLGAEGINCVSESTGGDAGRRVQFWPHSGKVRQKFMESEIKENLVVKAAPVGDIDLF